MQHRVGSEMEDGCYLRQDPETFGHSLLHGILRILPETEVQHRVHAMKEEQIYNSTHS